MIGARSLLYVPGNRPDLMEKAAARSGADALILDLEDAVPPAAKDEARRAVAAWLRRGAGAATAVVRVNAGEALEADLAALREARGVAAISLPKVASCADLERCDALLGDWDVPVLALVESATGVLDARAIAAHPRVVRLALGEADLAAELGAEPSEHGAEMLAVRTQILLASAAAGIAPPVAPVSTDFRDLDALRRTTLALRRMGFGGRAAIHPAQVPVINQAFTPSAEEVERARRIVARFEEAGGRPCTGEDGRMIDEPVARAARRVLERSQTNPKPSRGTSRSTPPSNV